MVIRLRAWGSFSGGILYPLLPTLKPVRHLEVNVVGLQFNDFVVATIGVANDLDAVVAEEPG